MAEIEWKPFTPGETALDFGQRYVFADPSRKHMGIRWAHNPPNDATWCLSLNDLMATIPEGNG